MFRGRGRISEPSFTPRSGHPHAHCPSCSQAVGQATSLARAASTRSRIACGPGGMASPERDRLVGRSGRRTGVERAARSGQHHRAAQDGKLQGRAGLGDGPQRRNAGNHRDLGPGPSCPRRQSPQPKHRIVQRPDLSAGLHPRLRQHRLQHLRVAAGLADLRRHRPGKTQS